MIGDSDIPGDVAEDEDQHHEQEDGRVVPVPEPRGNISQENG